MAANSYSAIPENGNVSPGYCVPTEDESTQVSEEDFMEVEPTREASTQVSEEDLMPMELTREVGTQTIDDDSNFPLQNSGGHGYENCAKIDKTELDLDQPTNENHNSLADNTNTKEGEFHNRSYDMCNASTSLESRDDSHVASQEQRHTLEKSSIDDGENKFDSDSLLKRQPAMKPPESAKMSIKFGFTNSNMLRLQDPTSNYFPNFRANAENGPKKKKTFLQFVPLFRKKDLSANLSIKHALMHQRRILPKLGNQKAVAKLKAERKTKMCTKCGKYFRKDETFSAHVQSSCDPRPFKCDKCDKRFFCTSHLSAHQRVHTVEKPFKCSQCDFASKWPHRLQYHLKTHH